ncbi:MAG TPA: ATP-binding cassette domain-containing protein [Terriglobia bacterium]|nr:ATP-binding cassette domain-containing protein [Terriglobia bacterium]
MPDLMLDAKIKKEFRTNGRVTLTLDASFIVQQGITVLFGPSGSGKTTILRSIAGIVTPDEGRIELGGRVYFDSETGVSLPIQHRRIGFVFQDYLLFPHLTSVQNVAYAIRSATHKGRRDRAIELLDLLGIAHASDRHPHQLSGGEQQRVALARAFGADPAILLLDEPLSALDAATRLRLLGEIVDLQRKSKIPFLYVTHSPADAVRAGDYALILSSGRIVQEGKPTEVFNAPRNSAASQAVGSENILAGRVQAHHEPEGTSVIDLTGCELVIPFNALPKNTLVTVGIRSDDIIISRERIGQTSARNLFEGTIKHAVRDGPAVDLQMSCGVDLKVRVTAQAFEALDLKPGVKAYVLIKASSCHLLP